MQRMFYNKIVFTVIVCAEKIRVPHIFSLFFPYDFEIISFDALISLMLCHCIYIMTMCVLLY